MINSIEYRKSSMIMLQDTALSMLATLLSILIVRWLSNPVYNFKTIVLESLLCSGMFSLIGFYVNGTHRIIIRHTSITSMDKFFLAGLIKEILLGTVYVTKIINVPLKMGLFIIMTDFLLMIFIILITRFFFVKIYGNDLTEITAKAKALRVLINGTEDEALVLNNIIGLQERFNVLGFLTKDKSLNGNYLKNKKVYSYENKEDIKQICWHLGGMNGLVLTQKDSENEKELIKICLDFGIQIILMPDLDSMTENKLSEKRKDDPTEFDPDFITDPMSLLQRLFKRGFDVFVSGLLMIIFSPAYLLCLIVIKLKDKGPAIYKQERIGRFGEPFTIYKFRTMRTDAEDSGPALFSGENDPRLTKTGTYLRKHHLDELPQLWNVFKGDMSFVGYRPERQYYIDQIMKIDPRYKYLYQIRPGVTSYSTLHNGYADTMKKMLQRLELDLYYLSNHSIAFDIKVLANTFTKIMFGKVF